MVSLGESFDSFSNTLYNSSAFVAWNEGEPCLWVCSSHSVKVSMANGNVDHLEKDKDGIMKRRLYLDPNFMSFWWSYVDFFDAHSAVSLQCNGSLALDHLELTLVWHKIR